MVVVLFACAVLSFQTPTQPATPAELAAHIQALGQDRIAGNAERAVAELVTAGPASRPALAEALDDADPQRRFLAAWLLAYVGIPDDQVGTVCRTLIVHLGADRIHGNGAMAYAALIRTGYEAEPYLLSAADSGDPQQEAEIRRLLGWLWRPGYFWFRRAEPTYLRGSGWRRLHQNSPRQWPPEFMLRATATNGWPKRRLSAPLMSAQTRIAQLVEALGADAEYYNALDAVQELSGRWRDAARPALLAALESDDHQRRQFALKLLLDFEWEPFPMRFYEVAVEGLSDDGMVYRNSYANAGFWMGWLVQNYPHAETAVRAGVRSEDDIVRLRSAQVACWAGDGDLRSLVPVFVDFLAHDDIPYSAAVARGALIAIGEPARPDLEGALASSDEQQRHGARFALGWLNRIAAGRDPGGLVDWWFRPLWGRRGPRGS